MSAAVYIVDDDAAVRSALSLLAYSCGWTPHAFASAEAFLTANVQAGDACLLLDLDMPGMTGADLCERLSRDGVDLPIVIVTAHQDTALAERARSSQALLRHVLVGTGRRSVVEGTVEVVVHGELDAMGRAAIVSDVSDLVRALNGTV